MNVEDFAKYVIDNISRASLVNALNITNSFASNYNFVEFLDYMQKYIEYLVSEKRIKPESAYKVLASIVDAKSYVNSDIKYNTTMVIDTFIIKLWEIFNGVKNS
jgi:hypothetical protein